MAAVFKKVTFSLPPTVVDHLDFISGRMGVSRSSLVAELLAPGLETMHQLLALIPSDAEPGDAMRLRGESESIVRDRIADLQEKASRLGSRQC